MSPEPLTERVGQRTIIAILGALAAVVFFGGVLALVADDDALPAAGARLRLDGVGVLLRADGSERDLRDGAILHPGDEIELEEGTAVLELASGGTIEVRGGRGDVDDTRLEVGAPAQLLAGDALAQGPEGLTVEAAGTRITLRSGDDTVTRIRRELAVTTATYRGSVDVDSAGRTREVPAYRQLSVATVGRTPDQPDPFAVDSTDPWDQRFFGGVISLTNRLVSLSRAFTAQGTSRTTAADFAAVLPDLAEEPAFDSSFIVPTRPSGETLVGAAIALLGEDGTFTERWTEVFAFRDDTADWGLVAFDQGVGEAPVVQEVEAALSRSVGAPDDEDVAAPVVPPTTSPPATTAPSGPSTTATTRPTPTTAPTTTPTTAPTTTTPVTVPPITLPPLVELPEDPLPDTGNDVLDGLLDTVGNLLDGLLGGG